VRSFLPQEIIRAKRDGRTLDAKAIEAFVAGLVHGTVTEGQAAAFAMAVFLRGMSPPEAVALTLAMAHSGVVLEWPGLDRPVLDKHSTGGVGDKVSLVLAPVLAACGAAVPMVSGRGLGHTGGTLDKMDAIPGYDSTPSVGRLRSVVRDAGCAIVGQTDDLAPADRRLYAIRDVTATVESIPLITASILSKKLASGLAGLVMDVKVGNGAFMTTMADARALAESIVAVATGAGLPTRALITDMSQPLGTTVGNALEVAEAVDHLTGTARDRRLHEVVLALGREALQMGGLAPGPEAAEAMIAAALDQGAAAEAFQHMVADLGGPADFAAAPERHLPRAGHATAARPERPGYVAVVDTRAVGLAVLSLGGGRTRADQAIDHAVGLEAVAAVGSAVGPDRPLAIVHARSKVSAEAAEAALRTACRVTEEPPPADRPVISARVAEAGSAGT
jgi:thymidine phosphorylase